MRATVQYSHGHCKGYIRSGSSYEGPFLLYIEPPRTIRGGSIYNKSGYLQYVDNHSIGNILFIVLYNFCFQIDNIFCGFAGRAVTEFCALSFDVFSVL